MENPMYVQLAEGGLSMPLATNMVLHEGASEPDIERALSNGEELGRVVVRAARRFGVPLAIPHMDLKLEEALLLQGLRLGPGSAPAFHFKAAPSAKTRCKPSSPLWRDLYPRPSRLRSTPSASSWGRHRILYLAP
jgi:hypothetical protein